MAFMHLYMKYTQPLFIQGIMPLKSLFDSKVSASASSLPAAPSFSDLSLYFSPKTQILKIHLFGQEATGDLKRPFEAPAGMFGTPAAATNDSTPAAVESKKEAKKDK